MSSLMASPVGYDRILQEGEIKSERNSAEKKRIATKPMSDNQKTKGGRYTCVRLSLPLFQLFAASILQSRHIRQHTQRERVCKLECRIGTTISSDIESNRGEGGHDNSEVHTDEFIPDISRSQFIALWKAGKNLAGIANIVTTWTDTCRWTFGGSCYGVAKRNDILECDLATIREQSMEVRQEQTFIDTIVPLIRDERTSSSSSSSSSSGGGGGGGNSGNGAANNIALDLDSQHKKMPSSLTHARFALVYNYKHPKTEIDQLILKTPRSVSLERTYILTLPDAHHTRLRWTIMRTRFAPDCSQYNATLSPARYLFSSECDVPSIQTDTLLSTPPLTTSSTSSISPMSSPSTTTSNLPSLVDTTAAIVQQIQGCMKAAVSVLLESSYVPSIQTLCFR